MLFSRIVGSDALGRLRRPDTIDFAYLGFAPDAGQIGPATFWRGDTQQITQPYRISFGRRNNRRTLVV
jgi:hypothetical protein